MHEVLAGLVLAAGGGRRYGMPKALVRHHGRPLLDRSIAVLRAASCDPVVVVLGAAADDVRARGALDGVVAIDNSDWATGMGSSLRAGLAALADTDAVAVVVTLVDMPGVTAAAVRRVTAGAGPAALVTAGYDSGRPGHPVLLGRDHWAGVAALAVGDVGARPYLRANAASVRVVPCADVADDEDLDLAPQP
ncbi:nucleotidyltransferase family protein [Micromonospora zingiberis]|uniref:Nucleotidyltransferase family protein n=1 Tax=Micromonospora zingiberis TaxID=2053011 RepID=A0A4R0GNZ4_9ACTN|nr:nucleotidyltransferase family protein [Micromonospora zingiberis]TCB97198.1 nucleotidyltransferase family protein [Micromonospora zingiberis]